MSKRKAIEISIQPVTCVTTLSSSPHLIIPPLHLIHNIPSCPNTPTTVPPQKKKKKKIIFFLHSKTFTNFYLDLITVSQVRKFLLIDVLLTIYRINYHINVIFSITNNLLHERITVFYKGYPNS